MFERARLSWTRGCPNAPLPSFSPRPMATPSFPRLPLPPSLNASAVASSTRATSSRRPNPPQFHSPLVLQCYQRHTPFPPREAITASDAPTAHHVQTRARAYSGKGNRAKYYSHSSNLPKPSHGDEPRIRLRGRMVSSELTRRWILPRRTPCCASVRRRLGLM